MWHEGVAETWTAAHYFSMSFTAIKEKKNNLDLIGIRDST